MVAEVPRRCANTDWSDATFSLERRQASVRQLKLLVTPEQRIPLMNPTVNTNFVPAVDVATRLTGMKKRSNGWNEKRCGNLVLGEKCQNAWNPHS